MLKILPIPTSKLELSEVVDKLERALTEKYYSIDCFEILYVDIRVEALKSNFISFFLSLKSVKALLFLILKVN